MHMETSLLLEQSHDGKSGVDLPGVENTSLRTGQPERKEPIGLPQVSEPQVIRHYVRLSQQNFSIDANFYPLGSCTMKHNPRLNEKLARLPGFGDVHPLQPESTIQGALKVIYELQQWLTALTALPGITLNPAAGAHGELAGMMMIRKAHSAKGNPRSIVLVPDSAHGTNPATAVTCGYKTVSVATAADGMVDLNAFEQALATHGKEVAAFMLTNPNTCGIFEKDVKVIAEKLHEIGAFFYCDGANFNAICGKVRPGDVGVDVMQFNLHKTFSTPHGGGGPGCGPVVVCEELVPYLPVPYVLKKDGMYSIQTESEHSIGRIKGFHGQFGMMVRALSYILSHGADGLKQAAEDAVLNANYLFEKLKNTYYAPYPGPCMHECLLTDRQQRSEHDVSTMDIAKALIERGFHPMTVYFPLVVNGAMLIEPTESESKETLDAFIAAMTDIAKTAETDADGLHQAPQGTPRRRVDEVRAARQPVLRFKAKKAAPAVAA